MDIHVEPSNDQNHQPVVGGIITPTTGPPSVPASEQPPTPQPKPPEPEQTSPKEHNFDGLKSILSTMAIIIAAPLVAFALTAFVFQSYQVDGSSMETTLQNQDRLIVLKLPKTIAKLTGHAYVPHRGDIIIFNEQDSVDFGTSVSKQLVKRVIGLPGDRVVINNNVVTIYNAANPQGFKPDKTLPYGNVITSTPGNVDITVPPGHIYVCGDNRTNSLDSRIFGPIDLNQVVGKLVVRIFPFNKFEKF